MNKFLDQEGVQTLWDRCKNTFVTTMPKGKNFLAKHKINDYLYEIYYNTFDDTYANDYFTADQIDVTPTGCSAMRLGNTWGRNLDWTYDNGVEFVVHTAPYGEKKYAVLGVSGAIK